MIISRPALPAPARRASTAEDSEVLAIRVTGRIPVSESKPHCHCRLPTLVPSRARRSFGACIECVANRSLLLHWYSPRRAHAVAVCEVDTGRVDMQVPRRAWTPGERSDHRL